MLQQKVGKMSIRALVRRVEKLIHRIIHERKKIRNIR